MKKSGKLAALTACIVFTTASVSAIAAETMTVTEDTVGTVVTSGEPAVRVPVDATITIVGNVIATTTPENPTVQVVDNVNGEGLIIGDVTGNGTDVSGVETLAIGGNATTVVNGDITVEATDTSRGVSAVATEGGVVTVGVTGDISATLPDGVTDENSAGIAAGTIDGGNVIVEVNDDDALATGPDNRVHGSDTGILAVGDVKVTVDGVVSGGNSAITFNSQASANTEITVWKLESGGKLAKAADEAQTPELSAIEKNFLATNVGYIIKVKTTENGRFEGIANGDVKKTNEYSIRVIPADGYQVKSVSVGDEAYASSKLIANSDGTYTLIVGDGGGIELSALFEEILKLEDPVVDETPGNGDPSEGADGADDHGDVPVIQITGVQFISTSAVLAENRPLEEDVEDPVVLGVRRGARTADLSGLLPFILCGCAGITYLAKKRDD